VTVRATPWVIDRQEEDVRDVRQRVQTVERPSRLPALSRVEEEACLPGLRQAHEP
jgi:hypothetical protein